MLNLILRLRESYIARGLREEQLVATIADAAGPLRSCAATLLDLEGVSVASPKQALEQIALSLPDAERRGDELQLISEARESRSLPPGTAAPALFHLIELARLMWARASTLK